MTEAGSAGGEKGMMINESLDDIADGIRRFPFRHPGPGHCQDIDGENIITANALLVCTVALHAGKGHDLGPLGAHQAMIGGDPIAESMKGPAHRPLVWTGITLLADILGHGLLV